MRRIVFFLAIALALGSCGRPDAPASVPTAAPIPIAPAEATVVPEPTPPMANIPPAEAYIPPDAAYPAYPPPTTGIASTPADISLTTVPNQTAAPCSGCTPTPFEATATPNLAFIPPCLAADQIPPANLQQPTPEPPGSTTVRAPVPTLGYRVVASYPHDRGAFTEGLQYVDGQLYEGTGLNGQSELRQVDLANGAVLRRCALPQQAFGEGITVLNGKIYQLTWQNSTGMVYDQASFGLLRLFTYPGQGWGLTNDGQQLIMSDGTPTLRWLDPESLHETRRVAVYDDHGPVVNLNELEYVDGAILANIWQTDRIARIDPQSGAVTAWIDLSGLLGPDDRTQPVDVLNGIAYDAASKRLFVTGKNWPKLFEIELVPPS